MKQTMLDQRATLAHSLLKEADSRSGRANAYSKSKIITLIGLFVGLGFAMLLTARHLTLQEPATTMPALRGQFVQANAAPAARGMSVMASAARIMPGSWQFLQPSRPVQFKHPVGVLQSIQPMQQPTSGWQFHLPARLGPVRAAEGEAEASEEAAAGEEAAAPEETAEEADAAEAAADDELEEDQVKGTMVRWNDQKGFGFIKPDDGGDDVFVHISSLLDGDSSVRQGDPVKFFVDFDDRRGQNRAIDVTYAGTETRGPAERLNGTLINWNTEKGFGFIKPSDGGKDIFAHVSSLVKGDGSVVPGDNVTYVNEFNERKGQSQAMKVFKAGEEIFEPPQKRKPSQRKSKEERGDGMTGRTPAPRLNIDKELYDPVNPPAFAESPFAALEKLKTPSI